MDQFADVLAANSDYAASYSDDGIAGTAAKGLAVITCMDSRISPLEMLGLERGDAKILRNAGARVTDDVLRTLVLGVHLLNVTRVMVVPHTDCRMTKVTDDQVHEELLGRGIDTRSLEFRTVSNQIEELRHDVQKIRSYPFLTPELAVVGCIYDVKSGRLEVAVPQD